MRLTIFALLTFFLLALPAHAAETHFVDGTGQKVAYGLDAKRIVSLAPNVTEMLFFVGLGDRVVGRSTYCNYPPEAQKLPTVGGFVDTSLEMIVALQPDLVVAYQGNGLELIGQLRQLRLTVVAFPEATSLQEIGQQMEQLAKVALPAWPPKGTGPEIVGASRLTRWQSRLDQLCDKSAGPEAERVFYGMPGEVSYTAAPGSFIDDMIRQAGGVNVVPKGKERWPQVNAEFILGAQPDWLLISTPCTGHTELAKAATDIVNSLAADPVWSKLVAVQKFQIVVIEADVLLRPGPRILDALDQLVAAFEGGTK